MAVNGGEMDGSSSDWSLHPPGLRGSAGTNYDLIGWSVDWLVQTERLNGEIEQNEKIDTFLRHPVTS